MLTKREVREIFKQELPGVDIANVERIPYVESAMKHSFIRKQIEVGIYDERNIFTEFLSVACSYVPLNRVEYCYELIMLLADGVPDDITRRYLAYVAHHERQHFDTSHRPKSWQEHALAEVDCIRHADASAETDFAERSPVYLRVLSRIALIERGLRS